MRHHIGAKVLAINYGLPNSIDTLDFTYGIEGVYSYRLTDLFSIAVPGKLGVVNVPEDINNRRFASADGLVQVHLYNDTTMFIPYVFGGVGTTWETELGLHPNVPVGLGANIKVGKNSFINVQGEYRYSTEENRSNIQLGLGAIFRLGGLEPDRDFDEVPDRLDDCPDEPGLVALNGCPDKDGDGVADKNDDCPDEAGEEYLNGCPDRDGDGVADANDDCPDEVGAVLGCPDRDEDGIADKDDKCPNEAGVVELGGCPDADGDGIADAEDDCPNEPGVAAKNGCPDKDTDEDGIADEADKCPDEAGPRSTGGCPDKDGDGVADQDDRCPDEAGPYAGCPDSDEDGVIDADDRCPNQAGPITNKGCPEIEEEVQEVLNFAMRNVEFETGRATLKEESKGVLDQLVDIMNQYPAYSLRIAGHTDNKGDDDSNQVLSEERAKACYAYLVSRGISPIRLSYLGYGETRPVADNTTAQGRKLNRRTEFEMYLK